MASMAAEGWPWVLVGSYSVRKLTIVRDLIRPFLRAPYKWEKIKAMFYYSMWHISSAHRWRVLQAEHPLHASVFVSRRCTKRCPGCSATEILTTGKGVPNVEMTLAEVREMVHAPVFRSVMRVAITGGEPLLNKELNEIIAYLSQQGLVVTQFSNGDLLTAEKLAKLRQSGLSWVSISIYDDNREAIRRLFATVKPDQFDVNRIMLSSHTDDVARIADFHAFAVEVGARHLLVNPTIDRGRGWNAEQEAEFAQLFHQTVTALQKTSPLTVYNYYQPFRDQADFERRAKNGCGWAMAQIAVLPGLALLPCCALLTTADYGTIQEPEKSLDFRRRVVIGDTPQPCLKCPILGQFPF